MITAQNISKYVFRNAVTNDLNAIWQIILQAKAQMYCEKKQQWDDSYPLPDHIIHDINQKYAYLLCQNDKILAYGAVVFDGEPAYKHLDGQWLSQAPYVVVHRLAVADEAKRQGIATLFMQFTEQLSIQNNVFSFKVDTNFDNFYMLKILNNLGFSYCGEIVYAQGKRKAFEKLLKG